ncbi:RNA-guided endonuclease InsQ/TnpB family protein [Kribbella sindirgiensis]|uniref:Transposase n=1 Tax=Kribbella sindirgiensis TaxID=1124744 RepID=A0A4R0J633_9ACTN|nr:RNA-guided endonuclease TnpB family protein [Kribbella sindirgiensis]TCC39806.1 transposase [Kribbella sindirgiensis]
MNTAASSARYTYRLRVGSGAGQVLLSEWDRCRWVWNQCVAESRSAYERGENIGPATLDKMCTQWRADNAWLRAGASIPQKQIIRDFGKSRAKAIKDIADKLPMRRRSGMPGFKKKKLTDPSLNYTRNGFRLKAGKLNLAGGLSVTVVWSRKLPSVPSSVRIYRDSLGHWYASFVVLTETQPLPGTGAVLGIDWGVKDIATTTSDDHDLPHPGFGTRAAAELAAANKAISRRRSQKGHPQSNGYKKARRRRAKILKKVSRQRQDYARKWAKKVVRDHDALALEDFRPKFLAKSTMAKKAADAAIAATKQALLDMGHKHGRTVLLVHPAHTTMDCAQCGARAKHALPLGERTYTCTVCGVVSPRDKNSARVMLNRAGLNPDGADRGRPVQSPTGKAA